MHKVKCIELCYFMHLTWCIVCDIIRIVEKEKLIGQATLTAMKNGTGGLDAKTLARLCEVLDCQPGDLMEYVKAPKSEE